MRWPFGPPHLTLKNKQKKQTKTNKTTKRQIRNKEGLGSGEVALRATSPQKKTKKKQKTKKKTKKNKQKKTPKKKEKVKKHKNTKKRAFQLSVKIFFFLGGCPKIAFF